MPTFYYLFIFCDFSLVRALFVLCDRLLGRMFVRMPHTPSLLNVHCGGGRNRLRKFLGFAVRWIWFFGSSLVVVI
jgi:hypothetical protein